MIPALIAATIVFAFVWGTGVRRCPDGDRYTSGKRQPTPFNRRFCGWPPRVLMVVTWISFVTLASLLGGWKQTLLFMTLPGVWFSVTHPTTVDGPAMLLAWCSALAQTRGHTWLTLALSMLSGLIHERGPVFAALYAWSAVPLLGLVAPIAMGLLLKPAPADRNSADLAEGLVGHSTGGALLAHRRFFDSTSAAGLVWALRGIPLMAAHYGASPSAWASLGVAFASRLIGTDTARFLMWAAPPLCAGLGDAPVWMVMIHVASFKRVIQ